MPAIASAKRELEQFLSSLPTYKRKFLEYRHAEITAEDDAQYMADLTPWLEELRPRYIQLLQEVPEEAKQYRKRAQEVRDSLFSGIPLPNVRRGRPRLDDVAIEAARLENSGLSHRQAGIRLQRSADSIRKLIRTRYDRMSPSSR